MDSDADGRGPGCSLGADCDDTNGAVFAEVLAAVDADGDLATFGASRVLCTDGSIPRGYAVQSATDDCDETSPTIQAGCGDCVTLPFDSRVWQFCDVAVDRSPAATRCEAVGMFLASIHNDRQTEWVGDVIARLDLGYRVWIGLRENPPRWDDGSGVDYFNFIGGATTGDSMLEQCVNVMVGLLWDDDDCVGNSFPYVCASAP